MSYFEKDAILSGIGISQIGRRTGIPGLQLTLDAATAAIADAGLEPSDIDGIATLGDTPRQQVIEALALTAEDRSTGFDTAGIFSPLTSAILAVSEGRSRHVLVYRTVAMLGGSMIDSSANLPSEPNALTAPPLEPRTRGIGANDDIGELMAAHAYSASNWVAMHCRRHMELYGTTSRQLAEIAVTTRRHAKAGSRSTLWCSSTLLERSFCRCSAWPSVVPSPCMIPSASTRADHGSVVQPVSGTVSIWPENATPPGPPRCATITRFATPAGSV